MGESTECKMQNLSLVITSAETMQVLAVKSWPSYPTTEMIYSLWKTTAAAEPQGSERMYVVHKASRY